MITSQQGQPCKHCGSPIHDNGTVYVHRFIANGYVIETQWCDETSKRSMAEPVLKLFCPPAVQTAAECQNTYRVALELIRSTPYTCQCAAKQIASTALAARCPCEEATAFLAGAVPLEDAPLVKGLRESLAVANGRAVTLELERDELRQDRDRLAAGVKDIAVYGLGLPGLPEDLAISERVYNLRQENAQLRAAVANQRGDDLCWITDPAQIPPKEEFLKSCERYHAQVAGERGVLEGCKTIAQLEAEVEQLREKNKMLLKYTNCGGAPTGKRCAVDGHEIFGPFMTRNSDPDSDPMCEFHALTGEIDRLREQLATVTRSLERIDSMLTFECGIGGSPSPLGIEDTIKHKISQLQSKLEAKQH